MNFRKLITYLTMGTAAAMPLAVAQNPTILQGNYITNVFGNSNFVLNPNALTNTANVTVSSATVTRSTTTPLVATSEFLVTTSTSTGSATWSTRTFDAGMKGQNCEARFSYRGFSVGSTTAQILQGANVVAQLTLTPSTDPRIASINFPCGDLSSATTFRLQQATASLTGTNEIGGIYVGLATNMANVAQAEVVVKAFVNTTQSIPNNTETTVGYNSETLDTYGEFNTSTYIFTAKRAGEYSFSGAFMFDSNGWTINQTVTVGVAKNGTSATSVAWYPVQNTISNYFGVQYAQTLTLAVGDTARIVVLQNRGAATNIFASALYSNLVISRFPSSSELVVTPERQNVFAGVRYVNSNQNILSGSAASSTYSPFNNATWNQPSYLIGKAAVTTTNTGNDLGFSIPNLPVGNYKVSIRGLLNANASAITLGQAVNCSFKIRETTIGGTGIDIALQASRDVVIGTGPSTSRDWTNTIFGVFNNTSSATRNFRLEVAKTFDSTTGNLGTCQAYSASSSELTDISFLLEPLDQPSNSALYVEGPVKASATGAAIPAGYAGYVQEATRGSDVNLSTTAGTFTDITGLSISLDPGVWEIESFGPIYITGAAGTGTNGRVGVWQITDNSGAVQRENRCGFVNSVQGTTFMNCFVKTRLLVTSTTIYKARAASIENSAATTNPSFVQVNATGTALAVLRAVRIN